MDKRDKTPASGEAPGQLRRTSERDNCPVGCYGFTVRIDVMPVTLTHSLSSVAKNLVYTQIPPAMRHDHKACPLCGERFWGLPLRSRFWLMLLDSFTFCCDRSHSYHKSCVLNLVQCKPKRRSLFSGYYSSARAGIQIRK